MSPEYILPRVLKESLITKGLTFKKLSFYSGVPVKTLYHWANGQMPRDISQIRKVAEALGLSIDELAFGTKALKTNFSYELVLYRIDEKEIRKKVSSLSSEDTNAEAGTFKRGGST